MFLNSKGFDDVLVHSIYNGHPKLRGRAMLALSELVDANDKVKDRIYESGVLNVIEDMYGGIGDRDKNFTGTIMLEKIGIARLYWKAAEKHMVNREAIADRNGIYILCKWVDKFSDKHKFNIDSYDESRYTAKDGKNTNYYLQDNVKRCKLLSVYGITSLIYKDLKSKDLFLENSSILCLRSLIEYATGINPKGFTFVSLANKCRKSPKLRDHAVEIGLIDVIAIELQHFYEALIDPNEIYQRDIWTVVSCACEALEAMTVRYEAGQYKCIKKENNILETFSNILSITSAPDHAIIHVFECLSSICRGNECVKSNWKRIKNGPKAVRQWAKKCDSNPSIKGALTNALASTATGYSQDVAQDSMNITLL